LQKLPLALRIKYRSLQNAGHYQGVQSMQRNKPFWMQLIAIFALFACLWAGWCDFSVFVPRDQIQEAIREMPRQIIRIAVQFIGPALLLRFLILEATLFVKAQRKV
jgi:hypothetical protein